MSPCFAGNLSQLEATYAERVTRDIAGARALYRRAVDEANSEPDRGASAVPSSDYATSLSTGDSPLQPCSKRRNIAVASVAYGEFEAQHGPPAEASSTLLAALKLLEDEVDKQTPITFFLWMLTLSVHLLCLYLATMHPGDRLRWAVSIRSSPMC